MGTTTAKETTKTDSGSEAAQRGPQLLHRAEPEDTAGDAELVVAPHAYGGAPMPARGDGGGGRDPAGLDFGGGAADGKHEQPRPDPLGKLRELPGVDGACRPQDLVPMCLEQRCDQLRVQTLRSADLRQQGGERSPARARHDERQAQQQAGQERPGAGVSG